MRLYHQAKRNMSIANQTTQRQRKRRAEIPRLQHRRGYLTLGGNYRGVYTPVVKTTPQNEDELNKAEYADGMDP